MSFATIWNSAACSWRAPRRPLVQLPVLRPRGRARRGRRDRTRQIRLGAHPDDGGPGRHLVVNRNSSTS
jgi:hypothetical protein